jgi:ABC-type amino acid transport substrate-binding protein
MITHHKRVVGVYGSIIYFPKVLPNSKYLLNQFNKGLNIGLNKLKNNKLYQQILTNYLLGYWAKKQLTNDKFHI